MGENYRISRSLYRQRKIEDFSIFEGRVSDGYRVLYFVILQPTRPNSLKFARLACKRGCFQRAGHKVTLRCHKPSTLVASERDELVEILGVRKSVAKIRIFALRDR